MQNRLPVFINPLIGLQLASEKFQRSRRLRSRLQLQCRGDGASGLVPVTGTTSQGVQVTGLMDVGYYRNQLLVWVPEASTWSFWSVLVVFVAGYVWRQRRKRFRGSQATFSAE